MQITNNAIAISLTDILIKITERSVFLPMNHHYVHKQTQLFIIINIYTNNVKVINTQPQ